MFYTHFELSVGYVNFLLKLTFYEPAFKSLAKFSKNPHYQYKSTIYIYIFFDERNVIHSIIIKSNPDTRLPKLVEESPPTNTNQNLSF